MRFNLDINTQRYAIQSYGSGWINVNGQELHHSVIVMPDRLVTDWPPRTFADLEETHFAALLEWQPEIVLLGTGNRQQFPHPKLLRTLLANGVGVEAMDTSAACRTYNVIMMEDRRVAAALLMMAD